MVTVLFARSNSIYKTLCTNVFDKKRDATTFTGTGAVVAHPPCGQWGRLRKFAKVNPYEKRLAPWAVQIVQQNGGVLEHPAASTLWEAEQLPKPGHIDKFGGYSICINQHWYGHVAEKRTLLYIVGVPQDKLPDIPLRFEAVTHTIGTSNRKSLKARGLKLASRKLREYTPPALARWMLQVAIKAEYFKIES